MHLNFTKINIHVVDIKFFTYLLSNQEVPELYEI